MAMPFLKKVVLFPFSSLAFAFVAMNLVSSVLKYFWKFDSFIFSLNLRTLLKVVSGLVNSRGTYNAHLKDVNSVGYFGVN